MFLYVFVNLDGPVGITASYSDLDLCIVDILANKVFPIF
jgi:hypothetical protein